MPTTVSLRDDLSFSRLALGCWRLHTWNKSTQELSTFIEKVMDMGITTFDHADIYGNYTCESLFGKALSRRSSLRQRMQLVTKCGIMPLSDRFPERRVKQYNYSKEHILTSVVNSLRELQTDHLDVLLLHRPSPLLDPAEVAEAFALLRQSGKVRYFGVSNFTPDDMETLQSYLDEPLLTNQVEISPLHLEHFENGNMNYCLRKRMIPMAWSPLAGGRIFNPQDARDHAVNRVLGKIGEEMGVSTIAQVALCWLLHHPANIVPILGSGDLERIRTYVTVLNMPFSDEFWFAILEASRGRSVA